MASASVEEALSLKGSVLLHPSFVTPHDMPVFLRSAALRVAAGNLMLAAVFVGCVALVVADATTRLSCALACATCVVATWHYSKLLAIREQNGTRIKLSKPGEVPMGQAPELKLGWQELSADAVRYSDWSVTLVPLIVDLHLLNGEHTSLFSVAWSALLCVLMVALGAFTRLGTDELVPPSEASGAQAGDFCVRVVGVLSFLLSAACLVLVLLNLLSGLDPDPSNGWVYAFSLPWIGYAAVSGVAIVWRQMQPDGYPEALSVVKDVAFGALDVWSKAAFALYIGMKALGHADLLF